MASNSKSEKLGALEEQLLVLIKKHPDGIADGALARELGGFVNPQEREASLNRLLTTKRINLLQTPAGELVYQLPTAEDAAKLKNLTSEEVLVFQQIRAVGNAGIWTKDLRVRTNLAQPQINKILRVLESRHLIKSVKSVNNPNRKLYMLAQLEPSRDLTGGAWYTEQQFDSAFIDILRDACMQFITRRKDATLKELTRFIAEKQVSRVELREEDVYAIVNTLAYDNMVDIVESEALDDKEEHFRPIAKRTPEQVAFTSMPCGQCPVFDQCRDGGVISPATCEYFDEWLKF